MRGSADITGIAIIGMACRFPGADNPTKFWSNLCNGVESVSFFSDEELLASGLESSLLQNPDYVKASPILRDIDKFDASFFGYSPKEASLIDPQHRLFLEVAWETFEDAGYYPESEDGIAGVFAGAGGVVTSYLMAHQGHPLLPGQTAGMPHISNDKDFLSTHVSYKLNLTGPSLTVQTACSTSLVAVHLACQSLLNSECDTALAGAATVRVPHLCGYLAEKGNVHSLDGHCRAFDAEAKGTIFGSGVGAVLLKKVDDAIAHGDHIYAVIRGTAVNNDGAAKVSYTASSVVGQARCMVEALTLANAAPDTIQYVECHATGTTAGDPLEIEALTRAFRTQTRRTQFCAVGSVKSNIGHPEQAAGLAGLIKTALCLYHGFIPPSLNVRALNPEIPFANSPFYVNTTLRKWLSDSVPRRAGVNSLGIGGTNAFAVLEEAPSWLSPPTGKDRPLHLFALSAKSNAALLDRVKQFHALLDSETALSLADLCYTSNISRSQFFHRFAVTANNLESLKSKLASYIADPAPVDSSRGALKEKPVVFLFTGQGSQYVGMGRELYHTQPGFRESLERCNEISRPFLDKPLLDVMFCENEDPDGMLLHETMYTQPALFALEYALAQLWKSWGITPDAVIGHSIGEFVAACVAGVFPLNEALALVASRGKLMQGLPKNGAMAAVFAAELLVAEFLSPYSDRVSIAGVNSPQNTVVSGEREAVAEFLDALNKQGVPSKALSVSHAFHSPLMDPILDEFEAAGNRIEYQEPKIMLISNVTGRPIETAPGPRYWRDHLRSAVRFMDSVELLNRLGSSLFLEIGPGSALLGMGRQCLPGNDIKWLPSLRQKQGEWQVLLETLKAFYLEGFSINWKMVDEGRARRRIALPTYPFQRKRYWLESVKGPNALKYRHPSRNGNPLLGARLRSALKDVQFETIYSRESLPYITDHRIYGMVILPTTAGLAAAMAAGQTHFGVQDVIVGNLVYHEALALSETKERLVQIILTPQNEDTASFQLLSTNLDGKDDWRTHLTGTLSKSVHEAPAKPLITAGFNIGFVKTRCAQVIPRDRYYHALQNMGLEYGPSFQGIKDLRRGEGEALSYVNIPPSAPPAPYCKVHPAFLDACLHIYPTLIKEYEEFSSPELQSENAYLPIGIEGFQVYQDNVTEAWVHAVTRRDNGGKRPLVLDIRLYDNNSNLLARLDGLALRRLPAGALQPATYDRFTRWLYEMRWQEKGALDGPGSAAEESNWIIFADRGGVGEALMKLLEHQGNASTLVFAGQTYAQTSAGRWMLNPKSPEDFRRLLEEVCYPEPSSRPEVVYLWGLDITPMRDMTLNRLEASEVIGTGGALFCAQALAEVNSVGEVSPRLWIVTRNAQGPFDGGLPPEAAQAPLWGLGRTLALESPRLWGGLIDLPPPGSRDANQDAEALITELLQTENEDQVAVRNGKRFVPRFSRMEKQQANLGKNLGFRNDATYLITGGLGMLGLKIAQWLVERQGVRYLVLTGRRPAQVSAQKVVEEMERLGATVRVIQGDISVEEDVRRILQQIDQNLPLLKGVFHCAGILDDGVVEKMDWQKFTSVTAPKIKGSWLLHVYTQNKNLDFFLLHSSLLSLTGSAGQANYTAGNAFLDALVGHRRSMGLPAMAVNWGPWDEAGMATVSGSRGQAIWRAQGMNYIPPRDGIQVLEYLMGCAMDHAAVTITDWSVYLKQFGACPPVYSALAGEADAELQQGRAENSPDLQARLQQAPSESRRSIVAELIRDQVMLALGFEEPIDTMQPLNELGLDSLGSVTLANRLEACLKTPVPMVKLIQGLSIEQLVDDLFPDLPNRDTAALVKATSLVEENVEPNGSNGHSHVAISQELVNTSVAAHNGWLVFPKLNTAARVRLFCFPFAGAGAATFRSWVDSLDPSIEVVAIEPPGRAGRIHERPLRSLPAFLDALIPAMLSYLDKPFALFGHCLGGLTVYETARELLRHRQGDLKQIFVSGARAPHRVHKGGYFEEDLLSRLLKKRGFNPLMPLYEQNDDVFSDIIRHFNIGATEEFLRNPELRQLLLPTIRAEFAMTLSYRYIPEPPWNVPITCFVGLKDPYVTREDALAWGRYTNVAFRAYMREGTHFTIVDDKDFILETINRELTA